MTPSQIIYPITVDIRMAPVGKKSRNYDFSYWEGFYASKKHEAVLERTLSGMKSLARSLPVSIKREDRPGFIGIVVSGRLPRGQIGDMMLSEFLGWSNVADTLTLRRMIEVLALGSLDRPSTGQRPPRSPAPQSKSRR